MVQLPYQVFTEADAVANVAKGIWTICEKSNRIRQSNGQYVRGLRLVRSGNVNSLSTVPSLIGGNALAMGTFALSAATLAIVVVGFVVIKRELNVIKAQLDKIQDGINHIQEHQNIDFHGYYISAIDHLKQAHTVKDQKFKTDLVHDAIGRLNDGKARYSHKSGFEYQKLTYLTYLLLTRSYILLGELDAAKQLVNEAVKWHEKQIKDWLRTKHSTFLRYHKDFSVMDLESLWHIFKINKIALLNPIHGPLYVTFQYREKRKQEILGALEDLKQVQKNLIFIDAFEERERLSTLLTETEDLIHKVLTTGDFPLMKADEYKKEVEAIQTEEISLDLQETLFHQQGILVFRSIQDQINVLEENNLTLPQYETFLLEQTSLQPEGSYILIPHKEHAQ